MPLGDALGPEPRAKGRTEQEQLQAWGMLRSGRPGLHTANSGVE